jgi:hypothetical protein
MSAASYHRMMVGLVSLKKNAAGLVIRLHEPDMLLLWRKLVMISVLALRQTLFPPHFSSLRETDSPVMRTKIPMFGGYSHVPGQALIEPLAYTTSPGSIISRVREHAQSLAPVGLLYSYLET